MKRRSFLTNAAKTMLALASPAPAMVGDSYITTAKIDCCSLANNHILDWSEGGLIETLETLERVEVKAVGAGRDLDEASAPGILEIGRNGRVIVFAFGSATSGIPHDWAASGNRPGVNFLEDLSDSAIQRIRLQVRAVKRPGDVVIASVHWGSNWGYHIPAAQKSFAHKLLDDAGIDIVHGHSSHHPKGMEVYNEKPILYGCGDFLNDYEGISGHEEFRSELVLMYLISVDPSGEKLVRFEIMPFEIERFRLNKVIREDAEWLRNILDRECKKLGTRVELNAGNSMKLRF